MSHCSLLLDAKYFLSKSRLPSVINLVPQPSQLEHGQHLDQRKDLWSRSQDLHEVVAKIVKELNRTSRQDQECVLNQLAEFINHQRALSLAPMWQTQTPRGTPPKAQLPVPGIVKRAYIALARLPPNPSTLPKENITTEYSSGVVEPVYSSPDPLPSYPPVSHYTTTMAKGPEKDPPNRTLTTRSSDLSLGQNARLSTHSAANIATESLIESLSATPPLSHDSSMSICTQPRTSPRPSQHAVEHPTGDGTNHYQVNRASNSSRAWMRAARRRHRNAHRWRQLYSAARGAAENRAARRGSQSVQNLALTSTGLPTPDEILAVLPAEGILIKDFIAAFKGREKRNERAFVKAVQAVSTYDKKNKLLFPSGLSSNTRKTYLAATTAEAH